MNRVTTIVLLAFSGFCLWAGSGNSSEAGDLIHKAAQAIGSILGAG